MPFSLSAKVPVELPNERLIASNNKLKLLPKFVNAELYVTPILLKRASTFPDSFKTALKISLAVSFPAAPSARSSPIDLPRPSAIVLARAGAFSRIERNSSP